MVGFFANDILHGLRGHRPFHRMEVGESVVQRQDAGTQVMSRCSHFLHLPCRIPQIPCQAIHARVNMTGRTRDLPQS